MKEVKIEVNGMTCEHCVARVNKFIKEVNGIQNVNTVLKENMSYILANDDASIDAIKTAIENAGYKPGKSEVTEKKYTQSKPKNSYDYDLIIIGGGSAAFSSAIYAAEKNLNVCVIENRLIGGTCLNRGCVPSKHFLEAARIFYEPLNNRYKGVSLEQKSIDIKTLVEEKNNLLKALRQIKYYNVLEGYPQIKFIQGTAGFISGNAVEIIPAGETVKPYIVSSDKFIIATGSKNRILDIPGLGNTGYVTNAELLDIGYIPKTLLIQGTRALALEFAQMFGRFGSQVVMVGRANRIALNEEPEVSAELKNILRNEGIEILLSSEIKKLYKKDGKKFAEIKTEDGIKIIEFDEFLMAAGIVGNSTELNLKAAGVESDKDGFVIVNGELKTSADNIYAAGDITGKWFFVTAAAYEGKVAASNLLDGTHIKTDYSSIAHTTFTDPELSSVGLTEEQAVKAGYYIEKVLFPISYTPKAQAIFKTEGLIKMIAERDTGRVLGIHILAHNSSETIQQASLYLQNNYTVERIGQEIGVYPTMAEALKLCAQTFTKDISKLSCCA
ncbi:MAG: mercury(II) reductase [Deltaproteobacteria bacterium]|jgi:mercuric reductase|nr:mercury(II) reductase [Deltaproteobacteria bacterium]MCL5880745.1 mercury(II) reductase [Deltaproteobacteria bacterium]MDA8304211.1 mercury(II) reductase [Deltaproteobacteria bacterium]